MQMGSKNMSAFKGEDEDAQPVVGPAISRQRQVQMWRWDVFICHAGRDKPIARLLGHELDDIGVRCFVDEDSLKGGDDAPHIMQKALESSQIAVVLLSVEFFKSEYTKDELRCILEEWDIARRITPLPVFFITTDRCQTLAQPEGLDRIAYITGVRNADELSTFTGKHVTREDTLLAVKKRVCELTGAH